MKKRILTILFIFSFILTACSSNKSIRFKLVNEKENFERITTLTVDGYEVLTVEEVEKRKQITDKEFEELKGSMKNLNSIEGVKFEVEKGADIVSIRFFMDLRRVSSEFIEYMGAPFDSKRNHKLEKFEEFFLNNGYKKVLDDQ